MKGTLTGFFTSALIHAGLFTWLITVWGSPLPRAAQPESIALTLAMFKESPKPAVQPVPETVVPEPVPAIEDKVSHHQSSKQIHKPAKKQHRQKAKTITRKKVTRKHRVKRPLKQKIKPKKRHPQQRPQPRPRQQPHPAVTHSPRKPVHVQQHPVPAKAVRHAPQQARPASKIRRAAGSSTRQPVPHAASPVVSPVRANRAEASYKARLQRLIESMKHYPQRARRRGKQGRVLVRFTILPNGVIKDIRIGKSSGNGVLDNAAIKAVRKVSGKLPFPREITRDQWVLSVPIVYAIR